MTYFRSHTFIHIKYKEKEKFKQVFHFTSAKVAQMIIEKQQLKVSLFDDLNDPFELYAMELEDRDPRKVFKEFKNRVANKIGLLCFSKNWSNPVLWSHYADRHKGVALQFNISSKDIREVNYSPTRLRQNFSKIKNKFLTGDLEDLDIKALLTTKFKHWHYEDEVRLIVNLAECIEDKGMYFYKMGTDLKINGVIKGALCDLPENEIAKFLPRSDKLKIKKARLAFRSFSVTKQRQYAERIIYGTA